MNNNKGFTLVELLAVLVILIAILSIAVPSITSSIERNKQKDLEQKKKIIISAAETLVNLQPNSYYAIQLKNGTCGLDVNAFIESNVISDNEAKDVDGNYIEGCVMYNSTNKKYEFNDECPNLCPTKE